MGMAGHFETPLEAKKELLSYPKAKIEERWPGIGFYYYY
jgi:hypothetical protein